MAFSSDTATQLLTATTLGGLLFGTGLRLTWNEIISSLRQTRLRWILPVNFVFVPVLALVLARVSEAPTDAAVAMLLLAAAPFAPVVPTFTRLARGDLALAGVLTAVFPLLAAFLTPVVCELTLQPLLGPKSLRFDVGAIFITLASTITLPLVAGIAVRHWLPRVGQGLMTPIRVVSEGIGAVTLAYVTVLEWQSILRVGWQLLLTMTLVSEVSFVAGYVLSGPAAESRRVVALGTANRNIALALLVAVASFPGTPIVAMVVANGLLLIGLGLVHVGWWRLLAVAKRSRSTPPPFPTGGR